MRTGERRPLAAGEVTASYPELLNQVPAILYIADTGDDGRWHYVSPQIMAILGFSSQELRADPTLWSRRLHEDDRERIVAEEAAAAAGEPDPCASEYRLHHRDESIVGVEALLRWDQPERGLIPPSELIPIAGRPGDRAPRYRESPRR